MEFHYKALRTLMGAVILSPCALADTHTATSTSRTHVAAAITAASDGDTVSIPAGTSTWSSAIAINKSIWIEGAGSGSTIITTSDTGGAFSVEGNDFTDPDLPLTFKGMTLRHASFSNSDAYLINFDPFETDARADMVTDFRITACVFEHGTRAINGVAYGVIDHCTFTDCDLAIHAQMWLNGESDPDYGIHEWNEGLRLGSTEFFVVEDCTFNNLDSRDYDEIVYGQYGSRVTFRYNTVNYTHNDNGGTVVDAHGSEDGATWAGSHVYEFYDNTFNSQTAGTNRFCNLRGGTMIFYNNEFNATSEDNPDSVFQLKDEGQSTEGDPSDRHTINNSFFYGNSYQGNGAEETDQADLYTIESGSGPYVTLNTDFFLRAPQSGDTIYPYTPLTYPHPRVTSDDGGASGSGSATATTLTIGP